MSSTCTFSYNIVIKQPKDALLLDKMRLKFAFKVCNLARTAVAVAGLLPRIIPG